GGLAPQQVPHFARVTVQRSFTAASFGPLPLVAAPSTVQGAVPAPARKGPPWFQAMDRNGDGFVSPQEFLGPPELFRRLDLDGDGLLSAEEAWRAESGRRGARLAAK